MGASKVGRKLEKQVIKQNAKEEKALKYPYKKKVSRSFEEIETELMHIEESIYAIECEMEHVADVERLEKLYEEKRRKSCYE